MEDKFIPSQYLNPNQRKVLRVIQNSIKTTKDVELLRQYKSILNDLSVEAYNNYEAKKNDPTKQAVAHKDISRIGRVHSVSLGRAASIASRGSGRKVSSNSKS